MLIKLKRFRHLRIARIYAFDCVIEEHLEMIRDEDFEDPEGGKEVILDMIAASPRPCRKFWMREIKTRYPFAE